MIDNDWFSKFPVSAVSGARSLIRSSLLALTACAALAACGGSEPDDAEPQITEDHVDDRRDALEKAGIPPLADSAVDGFLDAQEGELKGALTGTGSAVLREERSLLVVFPGQETFASGSSAILPRFYDDLDQVAAVLNKYPQSYLDIMGHNDGAGTAAANQALSDARAAAVSNYLRSRGVAPVRIVTYGLGATTPIAGNALESGPARNRRIEVVITPVT
ncbi:MAG: OmpA family protein [Pseudomonadota bacterium]